MSVANCVICFNTAKIIHLHKKEHVILCLIQSTIRSISMLHVVDLHSVTWNECKSPKHLYNRLFIYVLYYLF